MASSYRADTSGNWSNPATWGSIGTPPPTGYYPGKPFTVTGCASGTSGVVRVTLSSAFPSTVGSANTTWAVGDKVVIDGVLGTTEANGLFTVSAIDTSAHLWVELSGTTFAHAYVSGGRLARVDEVYLYVNVTLDAPACVGGYSNTTGNGGVMETGQGGKVFTIAADLVLRGSVYCWSAGSIVHTGGTITIDFGSTSSAFTLGYGTSYAGSASSGRIAIRGVGTGTGYAQSNSNNSAGTFSATNVDFSGIGTSVFNAITLEATSSSAAHLFSGCTFSSCGQVAGSGNFDGTCSVQVINSTWASSLNDNSINLGFTDTITTGTRAISGSSFDKNVNFSSSVIGLTVADTAFLGGFSCPSSPTAVWTSFVRTLVRTTNNNTLNFYGSTQDTYELKDTAMSNPHFHGIAGFAHSPIIDGSIWECPFFDNQGVTGSADMGDLVLSASSTSASTTAVIKNGIAIPTYPGNNGSGLDAGFSPGCGTLFGSSTGTTFTWYHNTIHVGYTGGRAINIGEGSGAAVASVPVFRDNLIYDTVASGSERGSATTQGASPTADALTGSGAKNNAWWRLLTTGIGGGDGIYDVAISSSGTPGASDLHAAPLFAVDPATSLAGCRRLATWAKTSAVSSSASTDAGLIADALTAIAANPFLIGQATTGLLAWVRAGYAPSNVAYATAASDGTTPGAVAYVSTITSATGTASGTSTVSGIGASVVKATGTASGTSTESGAAASLAKAAGSSNGVGSASGVGASTAKSAGTASGSSTVEGFSSESSIGSGTGTASGTSTVAGIGESIASAAGTAAGTSSDSGVGASTAKSAGTASGSSTVEGFSSESSIGSGTGTASGTSTVAGIGESIASTAGTSAGTSSDSGVGASTAKSTGTASGSTTVEGFSSETSSGSGTGTASGTSTVAGIGESIASSAGTAAGTSLASGVGAGGAPSFFESDLLAYLGGFTLTVHPGHIPEGESYLPGMSFLLVAATRWNQLSGAAGLARLLVQVEVASRSYIDCATISEQLRFSLQGYKQRFMGGTFIGSVLLGNQLSRYEADEAGGSDRGVHSKINEFTFIFNESIPTF